MKIHEDIIGYKLIFVPGELQVYSSCQQKLKSGRNYFTQHDHKPF